jgi:hypothetical protein
VGEHIAIIGTTGTGKTYLMSQLTGLRNYAIILRTKSDDNKFKGFRTVRDTRAMRGIHDRKLLIDPPYHRQASICADALLSAWKQGNWTVFLDELFYVDHILGLEAYVNMLLTQGRSKRLSIVTGMQRPLWVTRFALSEVQHVFTFGLEARDAKTLGQSTSEALGRVSTKLDLDAFEFAHFHRPSRTISIGNANALERTIFTPTRKAKVA